MVVNGLKSDGERATEAKRLIEWGFSGFESRILFAEDQTVGYAKLFGGSQGSVPLIGADQKADPADDPAQRHRPHHRRASSIAGRCRRRSKRARKSAC